MSDEPYLGGPTIPTDAGQLERAVREMGEVAGEFRAAAGRQAAHLRALHGWTGRSHDSWVASVEQTGRAALAIAVMLAEAAAVLRYLCRAVHDLRWRSAMLAARARVAGYDVGRDGTVQAIGIPLPVPARGVPPPHEATGPTLPAGSQAAFQAELEGRGLASRPDPWRTIQLDVAVLLDDACTAYAAARAGLRVFVDRQDRAALAPRGAAVPDGGGFPIGPLAAATAAAQLPGTRDELRKLVHRDGGRAMKSAVGRPSGAARAAAVPDAVAQVIADRRLGRAARLDNMARALDRIVTAAGQVPVIPVAASTPVGKIPPLRSIGVLRGIPIADVALAGWSVQQDVSRGGYTVPAAIGREGTSVLGGYAAGQGVGYLVVILGGPPVAAAIVAVGIGLAVGQLAGFLFDKASHHGR